MKYRSCILGMVGVASVFLTACTETAMPVVASYEKPGANVPGAAVEEPAPVYEEVGKASWYGRYHQGRKTASGERFDMHKLTAAHPTLPLGTEARVTNLENGKSVEVTVNDRGPYVKGRAIDLSAKAAQELGMKRRGIATVHIEVLPDSAPEEVAEAGG
jgi:peptidoglycan lytic transglycosylase